MIIREVKVKNFFCYLGEHTFSFTKGLNIISGRNSSGKSQFFNAFYWTFFEKVYSDETSSSNKKEWRPANDLSLYHESLAHTTSVGDEVSVAVQITLDANDYRLPSSAATDNVTYIFRREAIYKKSETQLAMPFSSELSIEFVKDGETIMVNRADYDMLLQSIFPSSIRAFMWYQGETMQELFDFSKDANLKKAINEISYFPKYDFMDKVVNASEKSINAKVDKELAKRNKLSKEQTQVYNDISFIEDVLNKKQKQRKDTEDYIEAHKEELERILQRIGGRDQLVEFRENLKTWEEDLKKIKQQLEELDINTKEKFIDTWMLNGCTDLIDAAAGNLNIINKEIQNNQKHSNPIPNSLPGPEYVEQMIKDEICYICERSIKNDNSALEALKRRVIDFEKNIHNIFLQESYVDLNRFRQKLITEIPLINNEISESDKLKETLNNKRIALVKNIENLYTDSGAENRADILNDAEEVQQLLSKFRTYNSDLNSKYRKLNELDLELKNRNYQLVELKRKREAFTKGLDIDIVENVASDYIKLFVQSIGELKTIAYDKLIEELQLESNRLYNLYLAGREQGKIIFNKGVKVIDDYTGNTLVDLNMGEQVAQKLAVANAFLSLSAQKMNRSYPLLADAPSSDLDSYNTYNLTVNIGKSFDQIIIMSKDYIQFNSEELDRLIEEAGVTSFYQINNENIDSEGGRSRINRHSVSTKLK